MKRILLTAEEAAAASESAENSISVDAFLDAIKQMEPSEIISKYGEKVFWAIITIVIGGIASRWVIRFIMDYVKKKNIAPGATKFIHGISAFLLNFIVILTAANVLGIPVTSVLAIFSVFTLAFSLAIKDIIVSDDFADTKIKLIFKDGSEVLLDERDYTGSENSPEKFHN